MTKGTRADRDKDGHWAPNFVHPEEAFLLMNAGSRVYVEGGIGHPESLISAFVKRGRTVGDIEIVTSLLGENPTYVDNTVSDYFKVLSFRGTPQSRKEILSGQLEIVPVHISAIPGLLAGPLRPDFALVQVTPPDEMGNCSLGASVLYNRAAIRAAKCVVAEINSQMPWTFGDSLVHISEFDFVVHASHSLPTISAAGPTLDELALANNVIQFVPNGATVQIGMGSVSQAIVQTLCGRTDIRLHAGLLSDGVIDLVESGCLREEDGAVVSSAFYGSEDVYGFIHRNPLIAAHPVDYTHDINVIGQIDPFISINSALEVDLSGQVNAEVVRGIPISGAGGQGDFTHGAHASPNGRAIIALTATSRDGSRTKIVSRLSDPGVVTTSRADVDVVATEFGVAELRGKGLAQRKEALLSIAHPNFVSLLAEGRIEQ